MIPSPRPENQEPRDATRRAFVATLTGAVAVGFAMQIVGCIQEDPASSGTPAAGGNGNCALAKTAADRAGTVASNHGHVAVVTTAQQDAATAFNLSIQGTSPHSHTLALTTQDLADLKAGLALTKTSSNGNGHTHSVTFAAVNTSIIPPAC